MLASELEGNIIIRTEKQKTGVSGERSKGENQQQAQPTYMYGVEARIWTRATFVGGKCSHHCAPLLSDEYRGRQIIFMCFAAPQCQQFLPIRELKCEDFDARILTVLIWWTRR